MTEMVFGTTPVRAGDPILPRWWRTVDRWSLACVLGLCAIGLLLGLAASVPLAEKNGLPQFYYVTRQAVFGGMALVALVVVSTFSPRTVRRIGVAGFAAAILVVLVLPFIGTDFGKGAVRWLRLPGGMSVQPSEFLKPCFVAVCAWFMASAQEVGGPPGRAIHQRWPGGTGSGVGWRWLSETVTIPSSARYRVGGKVDRMTRAAAITAHAPHQCRMRRLPAIAPSRSISAGRA